MSTTANRAKVCMQLASMVLHIVRTKCRSFSCVNRTFCQWDYTGLGMDYQLLAGPAFAAVFSTCGILWGIVADCNKDKVVLLNSRTRLLGCAVLIYSTATLLTAAATQYWQLVLLRMTVAAG